MAKQRLDTKADILADAKVFCRRQKATFMSVCWRLPTPPSSDGVSLNQLVSAQSERWRDREPE